MPGGRVPAEELRVGDMVLTRDRGAQPLRAVISRDHGGHGAAAPVVIEPGALGNDRRLVLSQQHRLLIADPRAELFFGHPEVLVAAAHLADGQSVRIEQWARITYPHLVFDRHEIVTAAGIGAETYNLPHPARAGAARCGIPASVDDRLSLPDGPPMSLARPVLTRHEAGLLAPGSAALLRAA